jgi:hypothetical protein
MDAAPKEDVVPAAVATDETPAPIGEETAEQKAERIRDEKGRFTKAEAKESAPAQQESKPKVDVPAVIDQSKAEIRPPQSWKPTIREKWATLPDEVRQEVVRRERETAVALQESSEARQGYQKFRETVAPFEAMIRAEGGEPLRAVESLLQTAAALRTAPLQTKAQMVAQMVRQFLPGREGIELLDAALSGAPQSAQSAYSAPVDIDRRVEEVLARRDAERQQQDVSQRVTTALAEVEGEEFFPDVKGDMADLLELAAKRGFAMTPKEAYNRAVLVHPEISKVLEQRRAASKAQGGAARSQLAASSVKSTPAAGDTSTQPKDLRETIIAAMGRER